jgi:hypothetical protein
VTGQPRHRQRPGRCHEAASRYGQRQAFRRLPSVGRTLTGVSKPPGDEVDRLVEAWRRERPELDVSRWRC